MSPVEISSDHNPLRSLDDRRLNRIAGPSGLIIFGVTGDLSRKKLMPAVYDLANRGLLPPGFGLVGFARRDWDSQDFEKLFAEGSSTPRSSQTIAGDRAAVTPPPGPPLSRMVGRAGESSLERRRRFLAGLTVVGLDGPSA